jgi:hypothetical protein
MPVQLGTCTTYCLITTPDERMFNNVIQGEVFVVVPGYIASASTMPKLQRWFDAMPNIFTQSTTIHYAIPAAGTYSIKLYDARGSLVEIITEEYLQAGDYTRKLSAQTLVNGVYFLALQTEGYSAIRKLLLIK